MAMDQSRLLMTHMQDSMSVPASMAHGDGCPEGAPPTVGQGPAIGLQCSVCELFCGMQTPSVWWMIFGAVFRLAWCVFLNVNVIHCRTQLKPPIFVE